ncbi:MAG: hypothetical protein JW880_05165 [Candidatus Thermoplasmatota archaeon]|nr:hypothetical protein [Candidatus Thermoplasmatota archaeon]
MIEWLSAVRSAVWRLVGRLKNLRRKTMVYGIALHHYPTEPGLDEMDPRFHDLIGATPVQWYRTDYYWDKDDDLPHPNNRAFLDLAHARGKKVLFILDWWSFPYYALVDEDAVRSHVRRIVQQLPDADAWEIWNEPNITVFQVATEAVERSNLMWGDPDDYLRFLRVCREEIRKVSSAPIISGGLSPGMTYCGSGDGQDPDPLCEYKYGSVIWPDYLRALVDNGAIDLCDAVGLHVYMGVGDNVYAVQRAAAITGKPVWVTEVGWPSCGGPTFSEEAQAAYLAENLPALNAQAAMVVWYCMTDYATRVGTEACFGVLGTDFHAKPAYISLRDLGAVNVVPALLASAIVLSTGAFMLAGGDAMVMTGLASLTRGL